MPQKMGVHSKAEEARSRKAAMEAEKKEKQVKEKEEKYWQEAEGSKSKSAKKREEDEAKRAEYAAKKAEVRRLAELEEKEIEKSLKKPDKKAMRVAVPGATKVTEAELRRRKEVEAAEMAKKAEETKKKISRMADEEEYEKIVLVENSNRDETVIEAHSVEEALKKISVSESLPVDKHPEKRLKASFKAFEEAELPRVKAEKPGLTHTQYKDMVWKLWKKSPDNPLNKEMDTALSQQVSIPEEALQSLLTTSNSSTLNEALQILTGTSRSDEGRSNLASKGILRTVLQLLQSFTFPSDHYLLLLSLRLLRNLCAGETVNQNLFIELNGVEIVSGVINIVGFDCDDSGYGILRAALQVLANISLTGEKHQRAIWNQFFPKVFLKIARLDRREICDPLCMIIYTCSDGSSELFSELRTNSGLSVIAEIARTSSKVGFGEDWLKLLISRICIEESHFPLLFPMLGEEHAEAYLLRIVSDIVNERLKEIHISINFTLFILGIFETSIKAVDFHTRGQSSLPTNTPSIDALGYSLTILRDACAQGNSSIAEEIVNTLVKKGFLDLLLSLLRELELPSSIRKTVKQNEGEMVNSELPKVCPYKGFRRDIVAVIGNCLYGRKNIQDEIRQKDGVILLLQQCVLDEDNAFLREWGIFCAKNLLEGNTENQQLVAELEIQGTVEVPELSAIGLRAEIDPNTRQAKLVNIT